MIGYDDAMRIQRLMQPGPRKLSKKEKEAAAAAAAAKITEGVGDDVEEAADNDASDDDDADASLTPEQKLRKKMRGQWMLFLRSLLYHCFNPRQPVNTCDFVFALHALV